MAPGLQDTLSMNWMPRSWDRKVMGLVLALLVLAIGFCVFDGDGHEDGHPGFDFCLGMLATVVTFTLVSKLPLAGLVAADHLASVLEFALRVLAPPPKTILS
jgi:hypothetical protein